MVPLGWTLAKQCLIVETSGEGLDKLLPLGMGFSTSSKFRSKEGSSLNLLSSVLPDRWQVHSCADPGQALAVVLRSYFRWLCVTQDMACLVFETRTQVAQDGFRFTVQASMTLNSHYLHLPGAGITGLSHCGWLYLFIFIYLYLFIWGSLLQSSPSWSKTC